MRRLFLFTLVIAAVTSACSNDGPVALDTEQSFRSTAPAEQCDPRGQPC